MIEKYKNLNRQVKYYKYYYYRKKKHRLILRVKLIITIIIITITTTTTNLGQIYLPNVRKLGPERDASLKWLGCERSADPNCLGLAIIRQDSIRLSTAQFQG